MKLISGLIFLFLVGCASVPDPVRGLDTENPSDKVSDVDANNTELEPVADKETAISPEVLYLLMTAEIAGQRNQYGVALEGYLQAAKRVDDTRLAERAAKIGLFLKQTTQTDEAVSLWLKQDEKNLTARKIAALSALRSADKTSAVKHLTKLLEDDPAGFESTLMELSKVFAKEGKADFIFDVLEDVAIQHQDQAAVFFVQSLLAAQLQKIEIAKTKVNQALTLQPDWNNALLLRAQLAAQTNDLTEAKNILQKMLQKNPDNERIRKMLAQTLIKAEAFDEAVQLYQDFLKIKPDDGESQFAIALIYLQQKKPDEASIYLKKLINKPNWDAQASFYLGRIEFKKEHYPLALVWFDKVTAGPYQFDASMAAISVLLNQKNYTEAKKRIDKISTSFPDKQLNILLLKSEIYNAQKNYQKAFDILTEALVQFPEQKDLLYTRALIAEKLDRLDILEADLKQILVLHPNDTSTLNALGYTLADKTDRYAEADSYLRRAIKLSPNEAVIIDSVGWLQFKQGKLELALNTLRKAYEKLPENEIAAHLVEVLWVIGKKTEATELFNQALKKSPEDEYLLKLQQKFLELNK